MCCEESCCAGGFPAPLFLLMLELAASEHCAVCLVRDAKDCLFCFVHFPIAASIAVCTVTITCCDGGFLPPLADHLLTLQLLSALESFVSLCLTCSA
jgi:hypothetical protein